MNGLVHKLLSRHLNAWQLAGFFLANLCGMAIVLTAIQFATDIIPLFTQGDSFMKPGQMVIVKRVNALKTLSNTVPAFKESQIADLERQPFTSKIGLFTPSQFQVFATIGHPQLGMQLSTEMFFESLPDEYVDIDLQQWQYHPGSDTIPIILPRNYLNLYNFGFASSRSMPTVSEGLVSMIPIALTLSGSNGVEHVTGKVVGFSRRLNTIVVPESFMKSANSRLAPDKTPQSSRLILDVANPADERIAAYLQAHNYDTETNDADAAKTVSLLRLIISLVLLVGIIITALAFYVLLLSIFLLLQKHTQEIDNLLLMGYPPIAVARPFHGLAIGLNSLVLVLALLLVHAARSYYMPLFGSLYPKYQPAAIAPTFVTALLLFLLVALLNYSAIRRKVMDVWAMHR